MKHLFSNFLPKPVSEHDTAADYHEARAMFERGEVASMAEGQQKLALARTPSGRADLLGQARKAKEAAAKLTAEAEQMEAEVLRVETAWRALHEQFLQAQTTVENLGIELEQAKGAVATQEALTEREAGRMTISAFTMARNLVSMRAAVPIIEAIYAKQRAALAVQTRGLWEFAKENKLPADATEGLPEA